MTASPSSLLRMLGVTCLALAWLVPNHYPPWGSIYNETVAAIGLALLFSSAVARPPEWRIPWLAGLAGAVAVIPWLQLGAGMLVYTDDAWMSSLYLAGFGLAVAVGSKRRQPGDDLSESLAWAALAASFVSSVMALVQSAQLTGMGIWGLDAVPGMRPYGNFGQPNNLATALGIGFAGLFLLYERGRLGVASASALSAALLLGIGVTQSRTALLYAPVALAALWLWKRRGLATKTSPWFVAMVAAAHWALTLVWPLLQTAMLMSASTSLGQREARTIRFLVWPVLLDAMSTRPWGGFGWQQVGAAELSAVDRHPPATELYMQAHNVLLDLAIFSGYPFALLMTGLLGWWLVTRMMRVKTLEAAAGMLIVLMFTAHAMLELPHHYAYFLIPVGLWVGIVDREQGSGVGPSSRWLWPVAALSVAGTAVLWRDYPRIEEEFRLVRFEAARIRTLANPEPMPSNPALSSLTAFLAQARRVPSKGMTEGELRDMRDNVERYPYAASLKRYAIALFRNGRPDEARHEFVQIRQMYGPKSYRIYRWELIDDIASYGWSDLAPFERSLPD